MPYVVVEKPRPHVSVVVMNRPERMNAMSFDTVVPLRDAIAEVGRDNDTWVVVLTGAGRGFCSGLDLEDHGMPPGCDGLPMSRIAMTKKVLWSNLETGSLEAAIDLENRNQLLVRLTTQNLAEAIAARKARRPPRFED